MRSFLAWHRRIGIVALIGMVLWAASGVLHPVMSRLQPRPAQPVVQNPVPDLRGARPLADVLSRHGITELAEARVLNWPDGSFYQVVRPGAGVREYFALADGSALQDGDRRYAEYLARAFLGDTAAPVAQALLQTRFDGEYDGVNRLLPVWRVDFDRPDHMRVYVHTGTDRLGTLVNDVKAFSSTEFGLLHRWQWLEARAPVARLVILSGLLVAAIAAVIFGMTLFIARRGQLQGRWQLRRGHRLLGMALSVFALMFFTSGLYHLLHFGLRTDPAERATLAPARIDVAALKLDPRAALERSGIARAERLSLVDIGGEPYYRISPARASRAAGTRPNDAHAEHGAGVATAPAGPAHAVYVSARTGAVLADGEPVYARALATLAVPGAHAGEVSTVTKFHGEYGFVFKRLPVQRVALAGVGAPAMYIDTAERAVAAVIDDADRREGWYFAYIHKHDWLVPLVGKDMRDLFAAVAALLVMTTAIMGGVLALRHYRTRASRKPTLAEVRSHAD